jgi:hypothetical protein
MTTAIRIGPSNRVAAGVTAAYLRDLTRRPAPAPANGGRGAVRGHRAAAARRRTAISRRSHRR